MNARRWTFALAAVAALGLAGCNQAGDGAKKDGKAAAEKAEQKPPVATVNGKPISAEAFALWTQTQVQKAPEDLTPEQRKQALDALVNLYVTGQEADKQGVAKEGETAARLELERYNVLANALFQSKAKAITPTDQDLKVEYDKQVAAMPKTEYKARHILVADEQVAKNAIAQIQKGAKFEDVAKKISTDGSKDQGGDLGWFAPGQMVKPFSEAVEKLQKGQMTEAPVKTDFGWHVIRLDDTRPVEPPPFDAVKDRLGPMVQQRQLREYIDGLRTAAKVEIKDAAAAAGAATGAAAAGATGAAGAAGSTDK
jgi:peptidyl-prolyl cis-trans isomerase C